MRQSLMAAMAAACLVSIHSSAQAPAIPRKVDFVRDVQPIFQQHCYECHGADKQMNGLRLDRRHEAMRGGTVAVIGPGSSASSRLYLRLIGTQFGVQMPKEGHLTPDEIETIKTWIDQGAEWPDAAAGDPPTLPTDPEATAAIEAVRAGNRAALAKIVAANPAALSRRGPGGSTPLMYAALVEDREAVRLMLEAGANPNVHNDANATALMWAVADLENTQRLIDAGADVNARSSDGRTPLMIAASRRGSAAVLTLLLDRGAQANVSGPWVAGSITALGEAALVGDADMIALLLEHGAKLTAPTPVGLAMRARCDRCVALLLKDAPKDLLGGVMAMGGPPLGPALATIPMLQAGADPKVLHPSGLNMLMLTAASDAQPVDAARALIERGLDVNAQGPGGVTALALARRHGATPLVDLLVSAGAKDLGPAPAAPAPSPAASPLAAIRRSLPLLQRSDVTFLNRTGCVSCHNNSQTAVTVALARSRGIGVDEAIARSQLQRIGTYIDDWRERALQAFGLPGDSDTVTYVLRGLAAEHYAPDAATDALARFVLNQQEPDGSWHIFAHRPPIESSDIEVTASSIAALKAYAAAYDRRHADEAVRRAAVWLTAAAPTTTEDHAFKVLGLVWSGGEKASIRQAVRALLATAREDGGWSQRPSLPSDAYATGEALVAMAQSGAVSTSDPAFARGVQYLLKTQLADGSWLVRTRALPIQPYFESDFPHGRDQFISAAATNWATQALIYAGAKKGT